MRQHEPRVMLIDMGASLRKRERERRREGKRQPGMLRVERRQRQQAAIDAD